MQWIFRNHQLDMHSLRHALPLGLGLLISCAPRAFAGTTLPGHCPVLPALHEMAQSGTVATPQYTTHFNEPSALLAFLREHSGDRIPAAPQGEEQTTYLVGPVRVKLNDRVLNAKLIVSKNTSQQG